MVDKKEFIKNKQANMPLQLSKTSIQRKYF